MAVDFPYRLISGLPPKAQQEIWQDFQKLAAQIGTAATGYDAFIDPRVTSDNIATLTFKTPFAAIRYLLDTLGKQYITLGWIRSSGGLLATETAALGTVSGALQVNITVIGPEGMGFDDGLQTFSGQVEWDLATFTDSSKVLSYNLYGLRVSSQVAGGGTRFFGSASCNVYAENCYFNGSSTTLPSLPRGWYSHCTILNMAVGANSGAQFWDGCTYIANTVSLTAPTITQTIIANNCDFNYNGASGIRLQTVQSPTFIANQCTFWTHGSAVASPGVRLTFDSTATDFLYMSTTLEHGTAIQACEVNITVAVDFVTLIGHFNKITTVAPSTGGARLFAHYIHARCETTFDITGPANVDLASGLLGSTLRGAGISGNVEVAVSLSTGTGLALVGVTDSVLTGAFRGYGTGPGGQAFTIDSGSARNTCVFNGQSIPSVASVNSSTTTTVIDFSGAPPSGSATGDFSGSYPGPLLDLATRGAAGTLIHRSRVTGDANNRWQIDAAGVESWGDGTAAVDTNLYRSAADILATDDDFAIKTAGKGLRVKEGSNAKMGTATLVAGTVTVATTAVTANSRIFLTVQSLGTVAVATPIAVTAVTAATSFVITSASITDTSVVAWMLVEPA